MNFASYFTPFQFYFFLIFHISPTAKVTTPPNPKTFKPNLSIVNMEKQLMDFNVFMEQDEDGIYVVTVPEIDGCYTQGKTLQEALERIKEAIEVCLEADNEEVNPMTFIGMQKVRIERNLPT